VLGKSVESWLPFGEVIAESLPFDVAYSTRINLSYDGSMLSFGMSTKANGGSFLFQNYQRTVLAGGDHNWQRFGDSLSLNVSAYAEISGDGSTIALIGVNPSRIYRLSETTGAWEYYMTGLPPSPFFYRMSLNENGTVLATRRLLQKGQVDMFAWVGQSWNPTGSIVSGQVYEPNFGYEVDLSSDGRTVAVATFRSSASVVVSCAQAFRWTKKKTNGTNDDEWLHMGRPPCPDIPNHHSGFGAYLALSGDGLLMTVGDYGDYGDPFARGHIHSYAYVPES